MKEEKISLAFRRYGQAEDLPEADRKLLEAARRAAATAYAPYSRFRVGAAVLLADGTVVQGNNQENAAFPSGLCAERVAVFHAAAAHPGVRIGAVAVAAFLDDTPVPASPCGACRQVLMEYEYRSHEPIRLVMAAEEGSALVAPDIRSMLPLSFNPGSLEKK